MIKLSFKRPRTKFAEGECLTVNVWWKSSVKDNFCFHPSLKKLNVNNLLIFAPAEYSSRYASLYNLWDSNKFVLTCNESTYQLVYWNRHVSLHPLIHLLAALEHFSLLAAGY